jgi:hypothetical protein
MTSSRAVHQHHLAAVCNSHDDEQGRSSRLLLIGNVVFEAGPHQGFTENFTESCTAFAAVVAEAPARE